jgi:hypothetical protein
MKLEVSRKIFETRETLYVERNIDLRLRIIVAVEKKNKYYIFAWPCARASVRVPGSVGACLRVRAYSLAYPACNSNAPQCDFLYGSSGSTIFFDINSYSTIFEKKKSPNTKYVV